MFFKNSKTTNETNVLSLVQCIPKKEEEGGPYLLIKGLAVIGSSSGALAESTATFLVGKQFGQVVR